jgi:purine-nucleoside phosphorylase
MTNMAEMYDMIQEAGQMISSRWGCSPEVGIVLGTGLGRLADSIETEVVVPYEQIPHFPLSTVETHAGKLILGTLSGRKVMAMQGRFHFYEGYSMAQVVFPVRVMRSLGAHTLVVSNACGGINPLFARGTVMVITDHINLLATNPLIGSNDERIGPRFPDMSEPYSQDLIDTAMKVALEQGLRLERGVYAAMSGPCLETRAEYRMLKTLGADVIGMSTVPEVIAAVHAGMKVLGLSVVTDACLPDALEPANIDEIIATAVGAEPTLVTIIEKTLEAL